MTIVTVPGANGSVVANSYLEPGNTALAMSISSRLSSLSSNLSSLFRFGFSFVQSVAGGGSVSAANAIGPPSALEVTSGGIVSVPGGYGFVIDGSSNANLSIAGGGSFFGGDGDISYTNGSNSFTNTPDTTISITAGNGTDVFNLSGTYIAAAGSGFDQYNLSGAGQVSLGGGSNQINISTGADTIFAGANPGATGIIGGSGSVFFNAGDSSSQVGNVVIGGSEGDTVIGGANNLVVYASPTTGGAANPGAFLSAGGGNETLYGAASQTSDGLWSSFSGGNDLLAAGAGDDALVAGSGQGSLIGGSGNDTFYVVNSELLSAITATTVTPGVDFLYNTRAGETLALTGFDTLYGAANSGAAASAVKVLLAGGASTVTLKDGTEINFATGVNGISIISS